jgi:D-lactate dehydrogenase
MDLIALFHEYGYHDAIIFGHAKDGNIHFVITQLLDTAVEIDRYDRFMKAVVKLVIEKYDGALKGEHGTGRNMAPFIETEWGSEAYEMMKAIKQAADPFQVLNPGVIINPSKNAHIENLKDLPQVEEEVDKCIECGFCEINCPSRELTMTPRRRIVARRALQRMRSNGDKAGEMELLSAYEYDGLDTCATDGLCATDCPVDINTGELVKRLRSEKHGAFGKKVAGFLAKNYGATEKIARLGIGIGAAIDGFAGLKIITRITHGLRKIIPSMPVWMHSLHAAKSLPNATHATPDVIYFSSCINRVMKHGGDKKSLQQTLLDLSVAAGLKVYMPPRISGHCCGQPFTSKGYFDAGNAILMKTIDALLEWSEQGKVPVMCDFSSCTYTFLQNAKKLPVAYQQKFAMLQVVDSVEFLQKQVVPNLNIQKNDEAVVLHPTCAVTKLHLNDAFTNIAQTCSNNVTLPAHAGCCGMAGDRGFLYPELITSATHHEAAEANQITNAKGYSSSTTCEMSLSQQSHVHYRHISYLIDETVHEKMKD